jgi:hypothetical protein
MGLANGIVNRRAPHGYGWFLMSWEICNRRFVEPASRVDVHSIADILGGFGCIRKRRQHSLVLACRGKQQAPVWRKCQTSEERCESFVRVYGSVPDSCKSRMIAGSETADAGRVGHDCRQRHGWCG